MKYIEITCMLKRTRPTQKGRNFTSRFFLLVVNFQEKCWVLQVCVSKLANVRVQTPDFAARKASKLNVEKTAFVRPAIRNLLPEDPDATVSKL